MIPKKIHYCWFGHQPLPESALKCIASWRKFFPDYEIVEWNEDNFDVKSIPYTAQAYESKKYAFVSDYARFKILYEHGGIYFDTDVEVIKPFDDIIERGPFMGFEIDAKNGIDPAVNPGLGLASYSGHWIYRLILSYYENLTFINKDGSLNKTTIVTHTTSLLKKHGLKTDDGIQVIDDIYIYPSDYYNPLDDNTGTLRITSNTRSIHWYAKSWIHISRKRQQISRLAHRIFGYKFSALVKRLFNL